MPVCTRAAGARVDPDTLKGTQIQDQTAFAGAQAGNAVAAGSNREGEPAFLCEAHAGDDVRHAGALEDGGRAALNGPVPYLADLLISAV